MAEFDDNTVARFWSRVDREGPIPAHASHLGACWIWTSWRNSQGYGRTRLGCMTRKWLTHRVAWIVTNGAIPEGSFVLHHCDNPPCCNPAHLWLGSNADNSHDRDGKGRQASLKGDAHYSRMNPERLARGERHGVYLRPGRLPDATIIAIRLRVASGERQAAVAKDLGVNPRSVSRIVLRQRWRHIS